MRVIDESTGRTDPFFVRGTEFFINLDRIIKPALGNFVEAKSRTWSRQDARIKTTLIEDLLSYLRLQRSKAVTDDYIHMVTKSGF